MKMIVDKQGQPCTAQFTNIISGKPSKYIQIANRNQSQMAAYKELFINKMGEEAGPFEFQLAVNIAEAGNIGDVISDTRKFFKLF